MGQTPVDIFTMKVPVLVLLVFALVSGSEISLHMTNLPNTAFWNQKTNDIIKFFSDKELVMQRLRLPLGEGFIKYPFPNNISFLFETIAYLIRNLSRDDVYAILKEGNANIIDFFLGTRFNNFADFENLTFEEASTPNLHLFPIEELTKDNLMRLPLDAIVNCIRFRCSTGLLKRRQVLLSNLTIDFWNHPLIKLNISIMNYFSPFTFLWGTKSTNLEPYFASLLRFDLPYLKLIIRDSPTAAFRSLRFAIYHLQSVVHIMILKNCFDHLLFDQVVQTYNLIREVASQIQNQALSFGLSRCFSALLWDHYSDSTSTYHGLLRTQLFEGPCFFSGEVDSLRYLEFPDWVESATALPTHVRDIILNPFFMLNSPKLSSTRYINLIVSAIDQRIVDLSLSNSYVLSHFQTILSTGYGSALPIIEAIGRVTGFKNMKMDEAAVVNIMSFANDQSRFDFFFEQYFIKSEESYAQRKVITSALDLEESFIIERTAGSEMSRLYQIPQLTTVYSSTISSTVTLPGYNYLEMKFAAHISATTHCVLPGLYRELDEDENDYSFVNYAYNQFSTKFKEGSDEVTASLTTPDLFKDYPPFLFSATYPKNADDMSGKKSLEESFTKGDLKVEADSETPEAISFIEAMLQGLGKYMENKSINFTIGFDTSVSLSGYGPTRDSLAKFGQLIALPQMKTLHYVESLSGYVPAPFLCPRVMSFLGVWLAMCWKLQVPLPWQFNEHYLHFLLYDWPENNSEAMDNLMVENYGSLFESIYANFDLYAKDPSHEGDLPLEFHSHRMFSTPSPYPARPSPFIFESRALEILNGNATGLVKRREKLLRIGAERYVGILKNKLRANLYQGRLEFQRHFRLLFTKEIHRYFTYSNASKFFKSVPTTVNAIVSKVSIPESNTVTNDLPGATSDTITISELFVWILESYSQKQLERFLCFVTGSTRLPVSSLDLFSITLHEGSKFSVAHTCIRSLEWYINYSSAADTVNKLNASITLSAGFVDNE